MQFIDFLFRIYVSVSRIRFRYIKGESFPNYFIIFFTYIVVSQFQSEKEKRKKKKLETWNVKQTGVVACEPNLRSFFFFQENFFFVALKKIKNK